MDSSELFDSSGFTSFENHQVKQLEEPFRGKFESLQTRVENFDLASLPFLLPEKAAEAVDKQASEDPEFREAKKRRIYPSLSASVLQILESFRDRLRKMNNPGPEKEWINPGSKRLSTNEIIRLAAVNFIQSSSHCPIESCFLGNAYPETNLCDEDTRDLQILQHLLASAEKVHQAQFYHARMLLELCDKWSSGSGTPVQRLVYYFSEALHEKIDHLTGRIKPDEYAMKQSLYDIEEHSLSIKTAVIAMHKAVPLFQIFQFACVQAIIEHVADARKIHIIDLAVCSGAQWIILMQALAARQECHELHLKITAIGTRAKPIIHETGERLMRFAKSVNLSFSFKAVMVADILDLNAEQFDLEAEEAVACYSAHSLMKLIVKPCRLEYLMRFLRTVNPCCVVVAEIEVNHNSPVFVQRFTEALFFFGAFFDLLEECMKDDAPSKIYNESTHSRSAIRDIVAVEGEERKIRDMKIGIWRSFFWRFGMKETELSMSSLFQADQLVKSFACGESFTLQMDGKSLLVGWKGTPLQSISVWKFC